jgi:DNA polymerase III epsilon subunit family exonuclease
MSEPPERVLVPDAALPEAVDPDGWEPCPEPDATPWNEAEGDVEFDFDLEPLAPPRLVALDVELDAAAPPAAATAAERRAAIRLEMEDAARHAAQHLARWQRRRARCGDGAAPAWSRRPLAEARFCVIDLETTGLRPGWGDEILEVGAVRVAGGTLGLEFASLVDPLRPISPAAQAVHGLCDADVRGAPPLGAVLPGLLEMARDAVLVFHNASFDLGFVQRALVECGREPLEAPVLDTVVLARRLLRGRVGLGTAAARLGLPIERLHRALPDARLTARLLVALLEVLQAAGAAWWYEVPGLVRRPPRLRRRSLPAPDLLARRLHQAIARCEPLWLAYRGARGVAPYEMRLRALRLEGTSLVACDAHGSEPFVLDTTRIEGLRPAP